MWQCALCEATAAGTQVRRAKSDRSICDYCERELARRGKRRCRKCNKVVLIAECGTKHKGRWCSSCDRAHTRAQYQAHRAERLAYQHTRYWSNPDAERQRNADYRAREGDAINARRRAARAANPEPSRAGIRRAYWNNPARVQARVAAWKRAHPDYQRQWRARRLLKILRGAA